MDVIDDDYTETTKYEWKLDDNGYPLELNGDYGDGNTEWFGEWEW